MEHFPRRFEVGFFFDAADDERFQSLELSLSRSLARSLSLAGLGWWAARVRGHARALVNNSTVADEAAAKRKKAREREKRKEKCSRRTKSFPLFFFFFRRSRTRQTRKRACGCPARSLRAWARAAPGSRCARSAPQARRALCMVRRCAERRSKKNSRRFKIGQPPCHCRTSPRKRDSVLIDFYFLPLFSNYSRRKKSSLRHERGLHF